MEQEGLAGRGPAWAWVERILFLLGLAVLLHPVLSSRFYWTLDGPSHAYTASLLHDLMLGIAPADRVWELNPVPVPNSLGHFLLALLLIPFEGPEALKVLHVLLLTSVPCLLRAIAKQAGDIPWPAHLVFPFTVALPFVMGYYNLHLGIALLLAVIWQWQRIRRQPGGKRWFGLGALLLLLYFAHALPFVLALFWIALHLAFDFLPRVRQKRALDHADRRLLLRCGLAALPALACMAWYMIASVPAPPMEGDYPYSSRLEQLWKPFVYAEPKPELVLWGVSVTMMIVITLLGRYRKTPEAHWAEIPVPGFAFLLCMVLLLCFSRNAYGNGSDVLMRVALLTHLAAVVVLPSLGHLPRVGSVVAVVSLAILSWQTAVRAPVHEIRTRMLRHAYEVTREIPEGQTVAVVYFGWERTHIAELGLIGRNITVRSNYELAHDHFPLWNKPEYTRRARELPADPLDALSSHSNIRGADLRSSDQVIVTDGPWSERERALIDLLDLELADSDRRMPPKGMVRIYQRNGSY